LRALARSSENSGSFEPRARARYEAASVEAPPRIDMAIDDYSTSWLVQVTTPRSQWKIELCTYRFSREGGAQASCERSKEDLDSDGHIERVACHLCCTYMRGSASGDMTDTVYVPRLTALSLSLVAASIVGCSLSPIVISRRCQHTPPNRNTMHICGRYISKRRKVKKMVVHPYLAFFRWDDPARRIRHRNRVSLIIQRVWALEALIMVSMSRLART
jgi:hypothetical protein